MAVLIVPEPSLAAGWPPAVPACGAARERTLYTRRFRVMGGGAVVRFVDDRGRAAAARIMASAVGEAERLERKYSRYLQESVISRINVNAGRTPVAVDEETETLVREALALAEDTRGAYDPTVGVLRRVWDFRAGRVPAPEEIAALQSLVDWRAVAVRNRTVFLRREGMELDLGGIGKEYGVDRVSERLQEAGVESALVDLAGDVRVVNGRGDGRPWKIGVANPRRQGECRFSVRLLGGGAVATSGDYERFFLAGGTRYHHLLDARTGWPARGVASVTVVAASAFAAGRAATASFLAGAQDGLRLLANTPGVEGALITEDGELLATPGMDRLSDLPGSIYSTCPAL